MMTSNGLIFCGLVELGNFQSLLIEEFITFLAHIGLRILVDLSRSQLGRRGAVIAEFNLGFINTE